MAQEDLLNQNRLAWEAQSFDAWVAAYGTPEQAAANLVHDPKRKLAKVLPELGDPNGLRIANPLGSHGRVAVSLALLGAYATVFDLSASNKEYAMALAEAASVDIDYEVGDFLALAEDQKESFDWIVMELGVLHYFSDLNRFVQALATLLKPQGKILLHEFHPLLKKAIAPNAEGLTLTGDYFKSAVEEADTPYEIFLKGQEIPTCLIRRWNLGETVTAFAENGFRVNKLIEEPSAQIAQLPGTFTLVATVE